MGIEGFISHFSGKTEIVKRLDYGKELSIESRRIEKEDPRSYGAA